MWNGTGQSSQEAIGPPSQHQSHPTHGSMQPPQPMQPLAQDKSCNSGKLEYLYNLYQPSLIGHNNLLFPLPASVQSVSLMAALCSSDPHTHGGPCSNICCHMFPWFVGCSGIFNSTLFKSRVSLGCLMPFCEAVTLGCISIPIYMGSCPFVFYFNSNTIEINTNIKSC